MDKLTLKTLSRLQNSKSCTVWTPHPGPLHVCSPWAGGSDRQVQLTGRHRMRTLCVAVVVLSLSSAAAGPLACDELLKPVEKRPDVRLWNVFIRYSVTTNIPNRLNLLFTCSLHSKDNSSETNNQTVVVHVVWHLVRYSHVLGQLRDCGVFSELPSVSVNVTAQAKANIYAANLKIKL